MIEISFSSPWLVALSKVGEHSLSYYLSIAESRHGGYS